MIFIVVVLIFLFLWSLCSLIVLKLCYREKPIEKLKYYDEEYILKEKFEAAKDNKFNMVKFLGNLVPSSLLSLNSSIKLEQELIKSDVPITVRELLIIKVLSSAAFTLTFHILSKNYIISIITFILVWNIPRLIISNRKKQKVKNFDSQLSEGIMIISNAIKAGYSFLQAIAVAAEETKDPFSKEFKKLLKEMSLGVSEEVALSNMILRIDSEDLRLIINAILIQKDIGGNLSEILDNIGETIRDRQKIKNELKTLTAQGKLSGFIVVLIPIFLGVVIYMLNNEYILLLFTTPIGIAMISISVINQLLGIMMIKKVVNIEM